MGNLLYYIALIFVVLWGIDFFGLHIAGDLIHGLLVIAVIAVILKMIRGTGV